MQVLRLARKKFGTNSRNNLRIIQSNRFNPGSQLLASSFSSGRASTVPNRNIFFQIWQTIRRDFPNGVHQLWRDYLTYQNINDTAKNTNNSWGGIVPRRQKEHQRLFRRDVSRVLPTVVIWVAVPALGHVYALLAVFFFPKSLLSRQFWTVEQKRNFANEDYTMKIKHFTSLMNEILSRRNRVLNHDGFVNQSAQNLDVFGQISTEQHILQFLLDEIAVSPFSRVLQSLSRNNLVAFSTILNVPFAHVAPNYFLRKRIQEIVAEIINDDNLLLEEDGILHKLSDDEVLETCAFRSLSTRKGISRREMMDVSRKYLLLFPSTIRLTFPTTNLVFSKLFSCNEGVEASRY